MRSEVVVDVTPRDMTTALLEDGRLVSLQRETRDVSYAVAKSRESFRARVDFPLAGGP